MMTVFQDFFVQILTTAPMVYYAAVVVELILVFVASGKAVKIARLLFRSSWSTQLWMAWPWALSFARYMQATVYKAFLVSALMFMSWVLSDASWKKGLSGMGRALMGVLIGVIIASVVNMFLRSSGMDYILSIISVFLFAGLTAWDNQKNPLCLWSNQWSTCDEAGQWPWLELYLDFINLFISLLRIFGRND